MKQYNISGINEAIEEAIIFADTWKNVRVVLAWTQVTPIQTSLDSYITHLSGDDSIRIAAVVYVDGSVNKSKWLVDQVERAEKLTEVQA